ncbi:NAD-P-binding protein [Irpex rosettiformis]|uniref:NAD-P-binding protein n=1 Tax=Irpex rosettiformis TaxID=378272 RepID=A0ACB8UH73_9APHY|nr:NAD-P-binding protein [Irpex rosettiformis]
MEPIARKILVVGGNGFVGSAVCRTALARGFQVTSISSSGRPYTTPKGHSPAWTSKVNWQKADALDPSTYAHLLPETSAVVHTLGTLLEDARYKAALKEGDVFKLLGTFASTFLGSESSNPLREEDKEGGYATLNRDAALRVCEAFVSSTPSTPLVHPRPFVYVSAEDIFRPFISPRYIETKREAECGIEHLTAGNAGYRAVYVRPSLIYHPHFRPLTSPVAALLDLSATMHASAPLQFPTPSKVLRAFGNSRTVSSRETLVHPSALDSVANALVIPPIHVDHVAEAICIAADETREDVRGVVDVKAMRRLIGWTEKGKEFEAA